MNSSRANQLPVFPVISIRQLEDCGSKTKRDIARLEADNLRVSKSEAI